MSGSTIAGRYRLEASIGAGGMAEVFRGFDSRLDRAVAVKILAPQYAKDPSFVGRFRREAQAAARLNHPNVVGVYDSGSDDGTHFIVMEFIEGRTLADFLSKGGRLAPTKAVEITERIADALDAAHAQGVIHRDIKSANVMVTRAGVVKVMDFGIARIAEGAENVTQTAAVLGTASYLSPEQAQGLPVDARSDIYSLGIVLYEMLAGAPPFEGDSAMAVAYKHVQETPPPPSAKNPDVPPALDAVVMRALAKNPANRYATAAEFRDDLERVRRGDQVQATPLLPTGGEATQVISRQPTSVMAPMPEEPKRGRSVAVGILIGVLIVAVLGGGLYLLASSLLKTDASPSLSVSPFPLISVIGEKYEDAKAKLEADPYNLKVERRDQPSVETPGTVINQKPPADALVKPSDTITLIVAVEPEPFALLRVIGLDVADATQRLTDLDLLVEVQKEPSTQTPGTVLDQSPQPGEQVRAGDTITLTVAEAPETTTVPDVTCQSFGSAKNDLRDAGLVAVLSSETRPENPLCPNGNKIAAQDPAGESPANVGDTVTLYFGEEPSPSPT